MENKPWLTTSWTPADRSWLSCQGAGDKIHCSPGSTNNMQDCYLICEHHRAHGRSYKIRWKKPKNRINTGPFADRSRGFTRCTAAFRNRTKWHKIHNCCSWCPFLFWTHPFICWIPLIELLTLLLLLPATDSDNKPDYLHFFLNTQEDKPQSWCQPPWLRALSTSKLMHHLTPAAPLISGQHPQYPFLLFNISSHSVYTISNHRSQA